MSLPKIDTLPEPDFASNQDVLHSEFAKPDPTVSSKLHLVALSVDMSERDIEVQNFLTLEVVSDIFLGGETIEIPPQQYLNNVYNMIQRGELTRDGIIKDLIDKGYIDKYCPLKDCPDNLSAVEVYKAFEEVVNKLLTSNLGSSEGIKEFQRTHGLGVDGNIGPQTAKKIIQVYFETGREQELAPEVRHRIEVYRDMQNYPVWKGRNITKKMSDGTKKIYKGVNLSSRIQLDVFDEILYFGKGLGRPLNNNRPFNSILHSKVPLTDNSTEPTTYIEKIDGIPAVRTYIGGKLVFASYTAPGRNTTKKRSPSNIKLSVSDNKELGYKASKKYWISGSSDITRRTNGNNWTSSGPMPYSVAVKPENGIHVHGGKIGGNHASSGCFRLPLYYAKHFFDIFNSQAGGKMTYIIGDLY